MKINNCEKIHIFNNLLLKAKFEEVKFCKLGSDDNINTLQLSSQSKEFVQLLLEIFPSWKKIIGVKQHATHHYTLDIHTLLVMSTLQRDPKFISLDKKNKLILLYTALFHDAGKAPLVVDFEHPQKSAAFASEELRNIDFQDNDKHLILQLIENHQIIGRFASSKITLESIKQKQIENFTSFFNLLKIFTLADIKSVQRNDGFYTSVVKQSLQAVSLKIENELINSNACS